MSANATFVVVQLFNILWGVVTLGTCAYAVFWLGQSPWWFALAVGLFVMGHADIRLNR